MAALALSLAALIGCAADHAPASSTEGGDPAVTCGVSAPPYFVFFDEDVSFDERDTFYAQISAWNSAADDLLLVPIPEPASGRCGIEIGLTSAQRDPCAARRELGLHLGLEAEQLDTLTCGEVQGMSELARSVDAVWKRTTESTGAPGTTSSIPNVPRDP